MTKQAPMLMESPLTNRVFVVTSYVDNGGGVFEAREKFDVTDQFDALARQRADSTLVRCRDCKHAYEVYWPANADIPADYLDCQGELTEVWDYYDDEPKFNPVPPEGYCFYGRRKEVDA